MQDSANRNIYCSVKIKPVDYPVKMFVTDGDRKITIKDMYNKTNIDEHSFSFDRVFDFSQGTEDTYRFAVDHVLNRAFDALNSNCCVIAQGVNGSGKSYSLFGDHSRQLKTGTVVQEQQNDGLISKTIATLLQYQEEHPGKQVSLTANFYEIYHDKIRDLLNGISLAFFEDQKLSPRLYEDMNLLQTTSNDPNDKKESLRTGLVKNGTVVPISQMEDLEKMFAHSFKVREKLNLKSSEMNIEGRTHFIFNLNLTIKNPENSNTPDVNSIIQFVRLGGGEKLTKGMSAENKGEKFQESIVINSDYLSLQNVIFGLYTGQKTINYDTSKLLKLLRLSVNQTSSILLLGCLNPNEANFEESLNTLSFVYRCKNYEELTKDEALPSKEIETQAKSVVKKSGKQTLVQQMQEQVNIQRNHIESLENDYQKKMQELGNILEVSEGLDKLVFRPNDHQWSKLRRQKEAQEKYDYMLSFKKNLDRRVERLRQEEIELKNKRKDFERCHLDEARECRNEIEKLKQQLNDAKKENNEFKSGIVKSIQRQTRNSVRVTRNLLDNKVAPLLNLPSLIQERTKAANNIKQFEVIGKAEATEAYEEQFEDIRKKHEVRISQLKSEYEEAQLRKKGDHEKMMQHFDRFYNEKSQKLRSMREELVNLYEICVKQNMIKSRIENGDYSNGRKLGIDASGFVIPKKSKFPELFATLGRQKVVRTNTASLTKAHETYLKVLKQQEDKEKQKLIQREWLLADGKLSKIDFNKVKLDSLHPDQLQQIIEEQIEHLQTLKSEEIYIVKKIETFDNIRQTHQVADIPTLQKEVDELRSTYNTVIKQYNKQRFSIETKKKEILARNENPEYHPKY